MRQLFQNLLDKAIKYMDRRTGGRIWVAHALCDGMHVFTVADNGPGVPPDSRESVFYVFRRAARAEADVEGKGVGLAVVRTVAANYDGRAWVDASGEGGAAFHLSLNERQTQPPREETDGDRDCHTPSAAALCAAGR